MIQLRYLIAGLLFVACAEAEVLRFDGARYLKPYENYMQRFLAEQGLSVELQVNGDGIQQTGDAFELLRNLQTDIVVASSHYFASYEQRLIRYTLPIEPARLSHYPQLVPFVESLDFDRCQGRRHSIPLIVGQLRLLTKQSVRNTAAFSSAAPSAKVNLAPSSILSASSSSYSNTPTKSMAKARMAFTTDGSG